MRFLMLCTLTGAALPLAAQSPPMIRRASPAVVEVQGDSERAMVRMKVSQELARNLTEGRQMAMESLAEVRKMTAPTFALAERAKLSELGAQMRALELTARSARRTPRFGVTLDYSPRETDRYGVYVSAVSPGGPADHAGIVAGDIITKIAGHSLGRDSKNGSEESLPGIRATEAIATLTVGRSVDVEIRRGTQTKVLKVTPIDDSSVVFATPGMKQQQMDWSVEIPTMSVRGVPERAIANPFAGLMNSGSFTMGYSSVFSNFELAPMNEKLGAYFGTSEGVLVVNDAPSRVMWTTITADTAMVSNGRRLGATSTAPRSMSIKIDTLNARRNEIPLQPGDVIVSIDGRKVSSPSQLMRVVGSYDRGDEFKLQIMRQKHAETVTVKMP